MPRVWAMTSALSCFWTCMDALTEDDETEPLLPEGEAVSTYTVTAPASARPTATSSTTQEYSLEEPSLQITGHGVPWEPPETSIIRVSRERLMDPFKFYSTSMDHLRTQDMKEKRIDAWGMVQIALSGAADADSLFVQPRGHGVTFTLRPDPRSAIPLQWVHIGHGAIPDSLADISCAQMTPEDLLQNLNSVLGTAYVPDIDGVGELMGCLLEESLDFGEAYGRARVCWEESDLKERRYKAVLDREADDEDMRRRAVRDWCLLRSEIPPRRVWDLRSNRVLPYAAVFGDQGVRDGLPYQLWAVSHSWVAPEDRDDVWTPINGWAWPVPLPRATSLAHIRVELLNMGAEYVWLDVLCLRQHGAEESEAQRLEEWETDVPTIGHVYQGFPQNRCCITYFTGLGLPLDTSAALQCSDRHWFLRVWTLQETLTSWLPGGLTGAKLEGGDAFFTHLRELTELAFPTAHEEPDWDGLVPEVIGRHCTRELDRLSGLAYFMRCRTLPLYNETAAVEHAWALLLKHVPDAQRFDIFLRYAADTPFALFPSWAAYVAAGPVLSGMHYYDPWARLYGGSLPLRDPYELYTDDVGRYCSYVREAVGDCHIVICEETRDGTPPILELRFQHDLLQSTTTLRLQPSGMHGVILQEAKYALIPFRGQDKETWVVVEVVDEHEDPEGGTPTVEVVKWAVIQVTPLRPRPRKTRGMWMQRTAARIGYVSGEEALIRTSYREQYIRAFERMSLSEEKFIIA
ncbi:hypothetical protein PsYK624_053050 [Phanerochaete sordida]|uniref:Heterokaryon incompatibility domain-containing protein n=1 Tax=Phanerochaete sordida TaxID=48140 RepID=A0A9P3G7G1_9APHY|nr:hypothetical protein PsYK624_053050 [Phanerochaete sordida]